MSHRQAGRPAIRFVFKFAIAAFAILAASACNWKVSDGGTGSSGEASETLFCSIAKGSVPASSLGFTRDLVEDCSFDGEDAVEEWGADPIGRSNENEVTIEHDESLDRFDEEVASGSARVTNRKRTLELGYGAMVQCFSVDAESLYRASGSIYIPSQIDRGIVPSFGAYLQVSFYEGSHCTGALVGERSRSGRSWHPDIADRWRDVATEELTPPEGARSAVVAGVVDAITGNSIGQPYTANFDEVSFSRASGEVVVP